MSTSMQNFIKLKPVEGVDFTISILYKLMDGWMGGQTNGQGLGHLWNHENMFEMAVVLIMEAL